MVDKRQCPACFRASTWNGLNCRACGATSSTKPPHPAYRVEPPINADPETVWQKAPWWVRFRDWWDQRHSR